MGCAGSKPPPESVTPPIAAPPAPIPAITPIKTVAVTIAELPPPASAPSSPLAAQAPQPSLHDAGIAESETPPSLPSPIIEEAHDDSSSLSKQKPPSALNALSSAAHSSPPASPVRKPPVSKQNAATTPSGYDQSSLSRTDSQSFTSNAAAGEAAVLQSLPPGPVVMVDEAPEPELPLQTVIRIELNQAINLHPELEHM